MTDKMITLTDAAKQLGVAPNTLRSWTDKGLVPCVRLPSGYRRFTRTMLEQIRVNMGLEREQAPAEAPMGQQKAA